MVGKMDYVTCWYKKAFDFIKHNPKIRCAFVSTNSICQGEQVASLWKPLMEDGLVIDFAYRTFRWESDSAGMAHVHCVIVGFSLQSAADSVETVCTPSLQSKRIYNPNGTIETAKNINAYLLDGPNVFVESRNKPICDVPEMITGNRPADGGHLIIENKDYCDFINREPKAQKYIKKFVGSDEFINNKKRYCLWLVNADLLEISKMPLVMMRVKLCKEDRENSPDAGRKKLAEKPTLFREINNPDTFIVIPSVSSEKRKYIPIGFMDKNVIASNLVLIIPNATLYEFGILTSIVHNAWMRVVAGRLKSDYRYSKDIVYNNFPWPDTQGRDAINRVSTIENAAQKITTAAQKILDVREKYLSQGASLADLYGENLELLFTDLAEAHRELDVIVLGLYGLSKDASEAEMVGRLFEMIG